MEIIAAFIEAVIMLLGLKPYSDIAQDFYGFRALSLRLDPYPPLGSAFKMMGIEWPLTHASTHPPTAYLLTAPVAFLPWPVASALWAWLMLAAIAISLRLYGLSWRWVIPLTAVCLFWPPAAYSLGQLTPLWLLGTALAYYNREKPMTAGAWIAFASLTKFLPGLLLVPFLLRRKWSAVAGFAAVWLAALALITALHPGAIQRYLTVNQGNSLEMIMRMDNGAFLPTLYRFTGWVGVLAGLILLLFVAWHGRKDWFAWQFLAVALLPIAWGYSLLPLLPGIIKSSRNPLSVTAVIITFLSPPFGVFSTLFFSAAFFLFSIATLIPIKFPKLSRGNDIANSPNPLH